MAKSVSLKDIMQKDVVTCLKTDNICDVANKMKHKNIGVVVVTNKKNNVQGIISERDILNKVVAKGLDYKTLLVQDIMTKKVITGKPKMSDIDAAAIFTKHNIKKLPIVDKKKLVGIVTSTDLLRLLSFKWAL